MILAVLFIYTLIAILPRGNNYESENAMMKDGELPILIAHDGVYRKFA